MTRVQDGFYVILAMRIAIVSVKPNMRRWQFGGDCIDLLSCKPRFDELCCVLGFHTNRNKVYNVNIFFLSEAYRYK